MIGPLCILPNLAARAAVEQVCWKECIGVQREAFLQVSFEYIRERNEVLPVHFQRFML
jgi:hypothetical protein